MIPDREVFQSSVRILSLGASASAATQVFAPKRIAYFGIKS